MILLMLNGQQWPTQPFCRAAWLGGGGKLGKGRQGGQGGQKLAPEGFWNSGLAHTGCDINTQGLQLSTVHIQKRACLVACLYRLDNS